MNLREIADRIDAHLRRFEADSAINAEQFYESSKTGERQSSGRPFYSARAYRGGRFVRVTYVAYQGASSLTKDEALAYLAWLDAGNIGKHYAQQRNKS